MAVTVQARGLAMAVLTSVAIAGCAMTVKSFVERGTDFGRYRTFQVGPPEALVTGDPRLDNNTVFQDHLQGAIERQLVARGLVHAEGTPDLLVHFHASVTQEVNANDADYKLGYNPGSEDNPRPSVFDAGSLTIDVIDTRTNRLVWRGWADRSFDSEIDDQPRLERRIDAAVAHILQRLPSAL